MEFLYSIQKLQIIVVYESCKVFDLNMQWKIRENLTKLMEKLSHEQMMMIPQGFNNNILWNLGHIVTTQQLLMYKNSELQCPMDQDQLKLYTKGTSPTTWEGVSPDSNYLKYFLLDSMKHLEKDLEKQIFKNFKSYTTQTQVTIPDFESCLSFNFFHEGLHLSLIHI